MSVVHPAQDEPNPMNFTENQHGNSILDKLKLQRESGKFCDVILYVENRKFYVHRNVLSSFSPYFESMFQSQKTTREKFNISGQSPETFQCFVNYMYTGSIIIDKNNVTEMFKLAHRLEVVKLKSYCAEYLERYLNLSNCLSVKDMADKYNMPALSKLAAIFIETHLDDVMCSSEILELDVGRLEKFLSDKSFSLSQMQIMDIIINWTKQDVQKREKQLKSVLKLIKWMEIDIERVNDMIENENLFVMSELSLYLMLTHLNDNGLTFAKFNTVLDTLNQKYCHFETEREVEDVGTISKVKIGNKKFKRQQRLLRANPIARLAALRSALVLKIRKCRNSQKFILERDIIKEDLNDNEVEELETSLKCHLCNHFSNDTTSLEQHLSSIHSRDVTYKCGVCGFVCQWNNLYIQHIKGHFPGPPYRCDSCEFTSQKLNEILTHRSIHIQEKIHRCPHCNFRSKSQASVLIHSKCHLSHYQPEKGGQTTLDRTYVCDLCGFNSKYLSHLIAHKRIHSGDVYRCSYPHCKYTTGKKSQLVSHGKSHQGVRPHCCNVCGRGFLEKSHLVRHERIHLEEKPFKCLECDYASSRRDKLKEHQARHHGDNASAKVPYKARPNKKSSQLFPDSFNDSTGSRIHQQVNTNEMGEVLVQNHMTPTTNMNSYSTFTSNDSHIQHAATPTPATLDFHHQQVLNAGTNRSVKDHAVSPGATHRGTHQSSAAAVAAAAMMLDPRFHHNNTAPGGYGTPPSMATMVNQTSGQVQSGHQMTDYPTALMSLF